ncbi:MAG TPA: hypothetical protein DG754_05720 [Bacteroidales bacterium]|nr:hypothetical protein [Bacteroidales bacterium]
MKRYLLALMLLVAAHGVHCQLPDGSIAPNFTTQDIDGNWHTLYDYLDQGKTVIINIISTALNETDGQSWLYFGDGALMAFQNSYGPNGTNTAMVIMIETDPKTPESHLWGQGDTFGNWHQYANFPIISNDDLGELFPRGPEFPSSYIVCPSRRTKHVGWLTSTALNYYVTQCEEPEYYANARAKRIVSPNLSHCGLTVNPEIVIENLGFDVLTSLNIEYALDGNTIDTYQWTGEISMHTEKKVLLPTFDVPNQQQHTFSVLLKQPNGVQDEETSNNFIQTIFYSIQNGENVTLAIETDNFPKQIEWQIFDQGNLVVQSGNYTESNYLYEETFCLTTERCYTLVVEDKGYDGMQNGRIGSFKLTWGDRVLVNVYGNEYTDGFSRDFCLMPVGETLVNSDPEIQVYPNPANNKLHIENIKPNSVIKLISITGSVVMETVSSAQSATLNVQNIPTGLYLIVVNNGVKHKPIKVLIN